MSSLVNDKRNVSVGDGSNNRDADDSAFQQESTSISNNTRQGSLTSVQNVDSIARASQNNAPDSGDLNTTIHSRFKALKVSCPTDVEEHENRSNLLPHHGTVRGPVPQLASQGTNDSYVVANQYFHGTELHSAGFNPPLYATAATTYMHPTNPYYTNAQPPGVVYPSQYGVGGYPYNTGILPSFMGGYPSYTAPPLAFDGVPTISDANTQGFDVQNINKVYGQFGFAPPFSDPRLQFHPSFGDPYNVRGQHEGQVRPDFVPFAPDHRPQHQGGGVQIIGQRQGGIIGNEYSGNPVNMGFYMPMPNSALASPVLPGSPIGVSSFPGGRSDISSPSSVRSGGFYSGWQGQRGNDNVNYQKPYSFLEELKSGKSRRLELPDITGHVVEFSVDQHGSRFIQQKLENCSVEDKASVFEEVVPHAGKLMTDVFGNYVIQKFFEYGTPDQRRNLAKAVAGQILPLSLQMYGCRVIQKALDVIELDQKIELVHELDGHVMRCVRDQNGNHVIQKCIECVPSEKIGFIISAFRSHVASLSMHPYGCRVIQRILEHCTDELQSQFIVDEILESVCTLAQDQYGNYVTQHVLEKGKPQERTQIIKNLHGQVVKMSQHKFASNVVEKCLEYGDAPSRELIIDEVVGQIEGSDNLLVMMKDQYANYVVQKILEKCEESQRELLLARVRVHIDALKKYTYGKHIVARFEQLFGEIQDPAT